MKMKVESKKIEQFMDIKELSSILNIKVKTLYANLHNWEIPHHKFGPLIRFGEEEVNSWLINRREKSSRKSNITKNIVRGVSKTKLGIDKLVCKIIDEENKKYCFASYGQADQSENLGKEVHYGSV